MRVWRIGSEGEAGGSMGYHGSPVLNFCRIYKVNRGLNEICSAYLLTGGFASCSLLA